MPSDTLETSNLQTSGGDLQAPGSSLQQQTQQTQQTDQYSNNQSPYRDFNAAITAANLAAQEEGSRPVEDNLSDYVTKGIPLTGAAVVNSFYNTAVEVGNAFGGDFHKASIEDEFGPDSDTTAYYQRHSGLIEGSALAVGSLIPGLAAVKVLKLAQAGIMGETLQGITGLASGIKDAQLVAAQSDLVGNTSGLSLFGLNTTNKVKAVLAGAADQALQGAVYQTATLATMHASPLQDNNTFTDNLSDIADAMKGFALFGGTIEGIGSVYKINKAMKLADLSTRGADLVKSLGLGNLTSGDRIASLYKGIQDAEGFTQTSPSRLSLQKLNISTNTAQRQIRQEFTKLAGGDEELGLAAHKFFEDAKATGKMDDDFLGNNLSLLNKIGRHGDSSVVTNPQNYFYLPESIDPKYVAGAKFDDLVSKFSSAESKAPAFTLVDPAYQPTITTGFKQDPNIPIDYASNKINNFPVDLKLPTKLNKYPIALKDKVAAQQADVVYSEGRIGKTSLKGVSPEIKSIWDETASDIYISPDGGVHLNPNSKNIIPIPRPGESRILSPAERQAYTQTGKLPPGSEPFNSTPLFLGLKDGKLFGEAPEPVVGDIAKPQLTSKGLLVGDTLYPQQLVGTKDEAGNVSSPFNPTDGSVSPLQANARYVWAYLRGIQKGDLIHSQDLPMLEQLHRVMNDAVTSSKNSKVFGGATGQQVLDNLGLKNFADGPAISNNPQDLLQHITNIKQTQLATLLDQGKNADQISRLLNSPQAGIKNLFNTPDPFTNISNPADSLGINHVRLAYDIANSGLGEGNFLRGLQATAYRAQLARDSNTNAVSNYLSNFFGSRGPDYARQMFSRLQLTKGAGDADITGAGQGLFSSANGNYNTLAQQTERIGAAVDELQAQRKAIVSDTLAKSLYDIRKDPAAAAEWGNFTAVRHMTSEHYQLLSDADALRNQLPPGTAILEGAVSKDKDGNLAVNHNYIPDGFVAGNRPVAAPGIENSRLLAPRTFYTLSPKVLAVEKASQELNNARNAARVQFYQAQGISKDVYNPDRLYAPPIDTTKYPNFAYVRQKDGYALGESGASIIVGKDAQDLQQKISLLGPGFDVITKNDIAAFKKAQGEYEYSRNFQSGKVNTELAQKGILSNIFPETRPENLISRLATWHFNSEAALLRDYVELHNAEPFAQIKALGERFESTSTSRFGGVVPYINKSITNPYMSYIRSALGISEKDNYPLWQYAQDRLQNYADTAFNIARNTFGAAKRGLLPYEDAVKISQQFGLGGLYEQPGLDGKAAYYGGLSNQLPEAKLLNRFVAAANSALGATVIRLDSFQQLIHAVTLPIMVALEHGPMTKELADLTSVGVPGTAVRAPGLIRSLYKAVTNYFNPETYNKYKNLYTSIRPGIDETKQLHQQMINNFTLPGGLETSKSISERIENGTEAAQRLAGTNFVNHFIHFVGLDVGRQIAEAKGYTGQELADQVKTFGNRVGGNLTAGQRGIAFSGPVGQAFGLFQTFRMNLLQQLFRNIGEGHWKSIAIAGGLQSSIFGLSSLPGFSTLNSLIMSRHGNGAHQDLYSAATEAFGRNVGDYLLYGGLSGLLNTSLYSRGDLNPRSATILPINPINFPSVQAGIRVYQMLDQLQNNLKNGGDVPTSLLLAAEHNGLSRPLTGLSELAQGFVTSPNGNYLAQTHQGWSDLFSIANMSRLLGARPLDEGVLLDALYRQNAAKVVDTNRLESLGGAVKTQLYNNGSVDPQSINKFLGEYAAAGGNQNNFNSWFLAQSKNANVSAVNSAMENFHSPQAQTLQKLLGGVPLPTYNITPSANNISDPREGLLKINDDQNTNPS